MSGSHGVAAGPVVDVGLVATDRGFTQRQQAEHQGDQDDPPGADAGRHAKEATLPATQRHLQGDL